MPTFGGFELQDNPQILLLSIPGQWLLKNSTPSWRIKDPHKGFQRVVNEKRARLIAATVLDQQRTFPNAIVLATDSDDFELDKCNVTVPENSLFLVVDGQHRLWAQNFSTFAADYACLVHTNLDERAMAELFLEINDNQKRVPSSLRWDLVRLVEPDRDMAERRAVDLIFDLATEKTSPLFQRIDLTGEQSLISLKQGSLAPELKKLVEQKKSPLHDQGFEIQLEVLTSFFSALRDADPDGWHSSDTPLYQARVIRALLQLLPKINETDEKELSELTPTDFLKYIGRIDLEMLSTDRIRERQGNAGIAAIRNTIDDLIFNAHENS